MTDPAPWVHTIVATATARPPTLGSARLICIDGPAGSGKTTLATAVAAHTAGHVVHMDDLYPGWSGMDGADAEVASLLEPLARDEAGSYRRFDWEQDAYAERVWVPPTPYLILEGVNSGNRRWARWCTVLAWVEADEATRLARGIARDGEGVRGRWEQWMLEETDLYSREATRARADLTMHT
ncbi:MAG TPA: 4-amino-4-deoxy-L-arabinose transferase [Marmoricola sp.]